MLRTALLAVWLVVAPAVCRGALLDDFIAAYPQAAAKLNDSYSHVRIQTTETTTDSQGRLVWKSRCEYLRAGDLFRKVSTVIEAGRPDTPVGFTGVQGGSAEKFFRISKMPDSSHYAISDFARLSDSKFLNTVQMSELPLFVATYGDTTNIAEYLNLPYIKLVSAQESTLDGMPVIEIVADEEFLKSAPDQVHLYFLQGSLAFAGWTEPYLTGHQTMNDPHQELNLRVVYDENNPLKIKSIHRWSALSSLPETKTDEKIISVDSIDFGDIPASEFTLAAFGVEEPASKMRSSIRLFLLINVPIFIALGILLLILSERRKRLKA
jgi:hypothetical protein